VSSVPDADDLPPERDLLANAKDGDDESFGLLVHMHQAKLRGFAARYLDDPNDVYDIVQDAFVDAYRHLDRFDLNRSFGPWLRAICKNRILNFFRSRRVRRDVNLQLLDDAIVEQIKADEGLDDNFLDRLEALRHCVSQLKPAQRELIELRYHARVSVKELAETMNQSAAALSMQLMRMRHALKRCMQGRLESQRLGRTP
jgi:RNA polymerase sigma-70 factor, ECF subfamily